MNGALCLGQKEEQVASDPCKDLWLVLLMYTRICTQCAQSLCAGHVFILQDSANFHQAERLLGIEPVPPNSCLGSGTVHAPLPGTKDHQWLWDQSGGFTLP